MEEDKEALRKCLSEVKLTKALKSIPKDSSPKPDGFGSGFIITCWEILKEDLLDANEFFSGTPLPRFFTTSCIVLILKVFESSSLDKFKRIRLCSVVYKIFSKIILDR